MTEATEPNTYPIPKTIKDSRFVHRQLNKVGEVLNDLEAAGMLTQEIHDTVFEGYIPAQESFFYVRLAADGTQERIQHIQLSKEFCEYMLALAPGTPEFEYTAITNAISPIWHNELPPGWTPASFISQYKPHGCTHDDVTEATESNTSTPPGIVVDVEFGLRQINKMIEILEDLRAWGLYTPEIHEQIVGMGLSGSKETLFYIRLAADETHERVRRIQLSKELCEFMLTLAPGTPEFEDVVITDAISPIWHNEPPPGWELDSSLYKELA